MHEVRNPLQASSFFIQEIIEIVKDVNMAKYEIQSESAWSIGGPSLKRSPVTLISKESFVCADVYTINAYCS
jgi:hypothetical protein